MQYELVNVTGVRDSAFTAELIVAPEDVFPGIVGVFEDSDEGNVAPGVSIYSVQAGQVSPTGEFIEREDDEELIYTPNLV